MVNKIEERIKNVMAAVFEVSTEQINDESSMDTLESWDSLKHMNLLVALEKEFETEFSNDEILEMLNYKLVLSIVKGHL